MRKPRLMPTTLLALVVTVGFLAPALGVQSNHSRVVAAVPVAGTPAIDNGKISTIAQVGDTVVVGGTFTRVTPTGSGQVTRDYIVAFDADTGAVSNTFAPAFNNVVKDLVAGPDGTVYVGGSFSRLNGSAVPRVVQLNVDDGSQVSGFRADSMNGAVNTMALRGNRLFVGGNFTSVGGTANGGLTTLDATTGDRDPFMNIRVTERHNNSGNGAQGAIGVRALDVNPAGTKMVIIGNFRRVDGLDRVQAALVDLGATATVDPDWRTSRFEPLCFNWAFDTYVRGVQMSPDGSYFVIAATGGPVTGTLCDTASRWEVDATGSDVQPTWAAYSGGDTLWAVAVTGTAVYVGGHQRWMNNPDARDSAGPGSVPRPGLVALDPVNGVPLKWNPGRNPRGAGAEALLATPDGLWVGSDTEWFGTFDYRRPRIAFFPLAGGAIPPAPATGTLPGNVYLAGPAGDSLGYRSFTGTEAGADQPAGNGGIAWSQSRGAFMVGDQLFYGWSDGRLYQRTYDGATFGPATMLDPYHDPEWSDVTTGSGQTYRGAFPGFYSELSGATGMFFSNGRLYYTLSGSNRMYYRAFTPDSGIVGQTRYDVTGGIDWSDTRGMFVDGANLYVGSAGSGNLRRFAFTDGQPSGTPTVVSGPGTDGRSWQSRTMFLLPGETPEPNQPPTARFTSGCVQLECSFDGTTSSDPEGTLTYAWDFGDGGSSTQQSPSHAFAAAGTYPVTLTVTDADDAADSVSHDVQVTADTGGDSEEISFVGADHGNANAANVSATVPAGTAAGDTMLLFLSAASNVTPTGPSGVTGWTQLDELTNATMTTTVWWKPAATADAGEQVSVGLGRRTKSNLVLAVYEGTDAAAPVAGVASDGDSNTDTHTTPTRTMAAGELAVSFWTDKSSTTNAWTAPPGVTVQDTSLGSGAGRYTSLLADSAGPVPAGSYGGLTASTDATSGKATMWTLALTPGDG